MLCIKSKILCFIVMVFEVPNVLCNPSLRQLPVLPRSSPTISPGPTVSSQPTTHPTLKPTYSRSPTMLPHFAPTVSHLPTSKPSYYPTHPSPMPTTHPSHSLRPTQIPNPAPTYSQPPTLKPTPYPTHVPTSLPSFIPSSYPTEAPTSAPTLSPSKTPSASPTPLPSHSLPPTPNPSPSPSPLPTPRPTHSYAPTRIPTSVPTSYPTHVPTQPSPLPTYGPSTLPTSIPTLLPSESPSPLPTYVPTLIPSLVPSPSPTPLPTYKPTLLPSLVPTSSPTPLPTYKPTTPPTPTPTPYPTDKPTTRPSFLPTPFPTSFPTYAGVHILSPVEGQIFNCSDELKVVIAVRGIKAAECTTAELLFPLSGDAGTASSGYVPVDHDNLTTLSAIPSELLSGDGTRLVCGQTVKITVQCVDSYLVPNEETGYVEILPYEGIPPTMIPTHQPIPVPTLAPNPSPTHQWYNNKIEGASILAWILLISCFFLLIFVIFKSCRGTLARNGLWPSQLFSVLGCSDETCDAFWDSAPFCCCSACYNQSNDPRDGSLLAARNNQFGGGYFGSNPNRSKSGRKKHDANAKSKIRGMGMKDAYHIRRRELILESLPFASGAGGQVYRGQYNGTMVAAKMIFSQSLTDQLDEFEREVHMLASLHHPNIITFYGVTHDQSQPGNDIMFIVEEFCAGGNLEKYCTRTDDQYTPAIFSRVVTQIFAAMRYMHSQGIAHRDLKPANVLLTATGEVKLADLGLARNFQNTVVTAGVGTPAFMPPEAFDDNETEALFFDASHWDIYALGIMVWSLWYRRDPWPRHFSAAKIMSAVTRGRRPPFYDPPAVVETQPTASISPPPPASPEATPVHPSHPSVEARSSSLLSNASSSMRSASSNALSPNAGWGDMSLALPPPPALRNMIDRMWSHAHSLRPEVVELMSIFTRDIAPHLSPLANLKDGQWEKLPPPPSSSFGSLAGIDDTSSGGGGEDEEEHGNGRGGGGGGGGTDVEFKPMNEGFKQWGNTWIGPNPEPLPTETSLISQNHYLPKVSETSAEASNGSGKKSSGMSTGGSSGPYTSFSDLANFGRGGQKRERKESRGSSFTEAQVPFLQTEINDFSSSGSQNPLQTSIGTEKYM